MVKQKNSTLPTTPTEKKSESIWFEVKIPSVEGYKKVKYSIPLTSAQEDSNECD